MFTHRPFHWRDSAKEESYYMLLTFEDDNTEVKPYCIVDEKKFDATKPRKVEGGKYVVLQEYRVEVIDNVRTTTSNFVSA